MQKRSNRLNWDDLRYFTALADTSRISAAATRLGVNYVTVSRRIDRLEESLEKKLFSRTNDGYFLTLDGEELQKSLSTVTTTIEEIAGTAGNTSTVNRTVKVSMVHSIADSLVLPTLGALQKKHPRLNIEIDTSTRNVSITKRETDIALRMALPETGDYISRRLSNIDYILCGTEKLAQHCQEGHAVPVVSYDQSLSELPESKYMLTHFGLDQIVMQTNSATVQRSAAMQGIGIALLPKYLIQDSGLSRINMAEPVQREIWLLARKNTSQITGVRLVIDSLVEFFKKNKDLLVDE